MLQSTYYLVLTKLNDKSLFSWVKLVSVTNEMMHKSTFQVVPILKLREYLLFCEFTNCVMLYSCVYRPFPLGSSCWGRTDPLQKINKKYVFETGAKKVRRKVDKMQDVSCQGRGCCRWCTTSPPSGSSSSGIAGRADC